MEVQGQISGKREFDLTLGDKRVSCTREDWEHGLKGGYEVTFLIERLDTKQ